MLGLHAALEPQNQVIERIRNLPQDMIFWQRSAGLVIAVGNLDVRLLNGSDALLQLKRLLGKGMLQASNLLSPINPRQRIVTSLLSLRSTL